MATRHRTIIRQEATFAAADAAIIDDLPVNPLSFIDIVVRGLNNGANALVSLVNMLGVLSTIEVLFKGSSIISLTPRDLFALQSRMGWVRGVPHPRINLDDAAWRLLLRVSFSRKPYWSNEGFPASRRGELQLRITPAASFTGVDGTSLQIETEELLDASFSRFLKYTTLSRTPAATGESDQELPLGNPIAGILLFSTTVPTTTGVTSSFREVRLLIDNQESMIPRTRWDDIQQNFINDVSPVLMMLEHHHMENSASAYTQNADTLGPEWDVHALNLYGYLDFDPLMDGAYMVQTAGRSSVKLRINADVANAQRIIPVEMIELAAAQT